ncbi:uncharacterized protein BDW70DRAFT_116474 [Aspergillus foveolatus]|uniref:uncharacterized protein n=1 Tax=Aspergillus foveolatus TaxID=210207 RepID=UPI003CCE48A9
MDCLTVRQMGAGHFSTPFACSPDFMIFFSFSVRLPGRWERKRETKTKCRTSVRCGVGLLSEHTLCDR